MQSSQKRLRLTYNWYKLSIFAKQYTSQGTYIYQILEIW